MDQCLVCEKNFNKKSHNQFLCSNAECKRININMLGAKYRQLKLKKYINCKICYKKFVKLGTAKTCSLECRNKNTDNIKLKYYIKNVMPKLKYNPKLSEDERKKRDKEGEKRFNNKPERKRYMKNYRKLDGVKQKEKESGVRYRERNPTVAKNTHLKRNYKITVDDYETMLINQNFVCDICKLPETSKHNKSNNIKSLAVDHCHTTGKVRGLLCWKCNTTLGKAKDSIQLLQSMISYLEKNKEVDNG